MNASSFGATPAPPPSPPLSVPLGHCAARHKVRRLHPGRISTPDPSPSLLSRDFLLNVRLRDGSHVHVGELQLHLEPIFVIKPACHRTYALLRQVGWEDLEVDDAEADDERSDSEEVAGGVEQDREGPALARSTMWGATWGFADSSFYLSRGDKLTRKTSMPRKPDPSFEIEMSSTASVVIETSENPMVEATKVSVIPDPSAGKEETNAANACAITALASQISAVSAEKSASSLARKSASSLASQISAVSAEKSASSRADPAILAEQVFLDVDLGDEVLHVEEEGDSSDESENGDRMTIGGREWSSKKPARRR